GLPFAHERFCWRDATGIRQTRFLSLWDQSSGGEPDRYWGLGRTLSMQMMNAAIASASDARQRVDEDAVYADLGLAHLLRHRVTHGAHVADLACGMPLGDSRCAGPAIVGVQLRPMESTLCISPGAHLFDAVRFVVAQADQAGAERVVVNASVGNIAGPHDGSSMFESAIDALVGERGTEPEAAPVEVVLPEGNSYLSRCHAWATIDPNCEFPLEWHLRPDDGTSSYLEIWLRPVDAQEDPQYLPLSLTLKPPGDAGEQEVVWTPETGRPGEALEFALREGRETIAVLGLHSRPANGKHWLGLLTVAPTAPYGPWRHCAPAGAWQLKIGLGDRNGSVYCNVYSQRDERSFGHQGRGRQAIIEDHLDKVHDEEGRLLLGDVDAFRRRVGTINGLANGKRSQVVGGLVRGPDESLKPARYSSVSIPVDLPAQLRRTLAITEDSPVLHGIHAAGCRSGSIVALSGTSMAAPQMTRTLAAGKPGAGPASAQDFNGTRRAVVAPDSELQARARLRRGR
ncbi:MAG TPA: hypothetical protein VJN44_19980, partial [Roseateles sp.]|nr:hypothetical protein [Roseateles sp.]